MLEIKELVDSDTDGRHMEQIRQAVSNNAYDDWESYYWSGEYLLKFVQDDAENELIVHAFEEAFRHGLSESADRECYLNVLKALGKLYVNLQYYTSAVNMLMFAELKDKNVPDWVHLLLAYAALHTNTGQRFVANPEPFLERLNQITSSDTAVLQQRQVVFLEYLNFCTKHYMHGGATPVSKIQEMAAQIGVLETQEWADFTECYIGEEEKGQLVAAESANDKGTKDKARLTSQVQLENLVAEIETLKASIQEKNAKINELIQENKNHKREIEERNKLVDLVTKNEEKVDKIRKAEAIYQADGHNLLGRKKILVIGVTRTSTDKLLGCAKTLGYQKQDFVFWNDYDKVKGYADRMAGGSFAGIIAGPMPHKVSGLGDNSSLIVKLQQPGYPFMVEARTESSELKITNTSFAKALLELTKHLIAIQ